MYNADKMGNLMFIKTISPNCISCKRMDIDTIGGEKFKIEINPGKTTCTIPDGYENTLQCKYYEECLKIFEEGYHVEKDAISGVEQYTEEIQKIEKKPVTRKITKKTSTKSAKLKE